MASLHLMCGLPASGKTTLAKQLEIELPALRLTPDAWLFRIVGDGHDVEKRWAIEDIQWEIARRALSLGVNVILENGFWSREKRDFFRQQAAAVGAVTVLHFLDVPLEELSRRMTIRNQTAMPDTFHVSNDQLAFYAGLFERPTHDELSDELPQ